MWTDDIVNAVMSTITKKKVLYKLCQSKLMPNLLNGAMYSHSEYTGDPKLKGKNNASASTIK